MKELPELPKMPDWFIKWTWTMDEVTAAFKWVKKMVLKLKEKRHVG